MGLFKRKEIKTDNTSETPTRSEESATYLPYDEQVQAEARRLHLASMILNANEEQKAQDAQKLGEVKLASIAASIRKIHKLRLYLNIYSKLSKRMKEHSDRMYEANKLLAANTEKEKELERFETLENIQDKYQRIRVLEEMSHANKLMLSEKEHILDTCRKQEEEEQKLMTQRSTELTESVSRLLQGYEHLEQVYRALGARTILEIESHSIQENLTQFNQQREALKREAEELDNQAKELQKSTTEKKQQVQAMEPHRNMLAQEGKILYCLDVLYEIKQEILNINAQHADCTQRQREESNLLERTFAEYQNVESNILTLNAELQRHRTNLTGINSYALQERAIQQKTQRQMLLSAEALWSHIQEGYQKIEEIEQETTQLSHNVNQDRQLLETLDKEVDELLHDCKEREYALTLSKSQDVIRLRSDLKEGVSCTVCGATHHPYHSDTMLEQKKLIGELQTAYELQTAELNAKEKQQHEQQQRLSAHEADLKSKSEYLAELKKQQETFVKEWDMYSELDRSFAECSPTTNREARTSMIRQLITTAVHDTDVAQHELDTYNFHQTQINEISEKLAKKEQEKNELTTRLNEANTGCQVLTRQIAILEESQSAIRKRYTRLYEDANKVISFSDWFKEWENNPEGLKQRIAELASKWRLINEDLAQLTQKQTLVANSLENCQKQQKLLESLILTAQKKQERCSDLLKEGERTYERVLEGQTAEDYAEHIVKQFKACSTADREQQKRTTEASLTQAKAKGAQEELEKQDQSVDEALSAKHMELDLWIRQYNISRPSVQYKELEKYFSGETNWKQIRDYTRETRLKAAVEQEITSMLREDIMEMQAIASQTSTDINLLNSDELESRLKQLEQEYLKTSLETAQHTVALQRNEKYKAFQQSGT